MVNFSPSALPSALKDYQFGASTGANFSPITRSIIINAQQMRDIENRLFAEGMPVPALMEKAALGVANRVQALYPRSPFLKVGVLVGTGHNGGDALVVARELWLQGYQVQIYCPGANLKELTASHARYARALGIPLVEQLSDLDSADVLVDGLLGFGLTRPVTGWQAEAIAQVNQMSCPVVSIDLPSGLHTDTGEVLGIAIRATHSFCLGLWKAAYFQDQALPYLGQVELLEIGIPDIWLQDLAPVLPQVWDRSQAQASLPLPRPLVTHKYQQGHLLLICGSRRYAGGAILTGLGARASGVGMLSMAVPASLKPLLVSHLPEALILDCPETPTGAIAALPEDLGDLTQFSAIAIGPGLTLEAQALVQQILKAPCPVIIDADGLNSLSQLGTQATLSQRPYPTVLTPHLGEFKRLFPEISHPDQDRLQAVKTCAQSCQSIVLFKGARTAIANPEGQVWVIPESTPALARGGSGDVLTGLMAGLIAQPRQTSLESLVATASWWHAQAGMLAAQERTELGVDAFTLTHYLNAVLSLP